jgi:MarR family transcriptional regulator, organic hydroperoxide resistance regulator
MTKRSLPIMPDSKERRLRLWEVLVRKVWEIESRISSELRAQGLTLSQFDVLATLRFSEGVTQQELAERLLVTKGNICGLLDRLAQAGWVERRQDESDRRANRLHLTPRGLRMVQSVLPVHDEVILEVFERLGEGDIARMREVLDALKV